MVDQAIWSKKMSNGTRRIPVSPEQVRPQLFQFNLSAQLLHHSAIHVLCLFTLQIQEGIFFKKEEEQFITTYGVPESVSQMPRRTK